jgi:adenine-specific DNA-methyltransferase
MPADRIKANGVHYTPPTLADFLAAVTAEALGGERDTIEVLDPACGDGALLFAFAQQLPRHTRASVVLHGYETDPGVLHNARQLLADMGVNRAVEHGIPHVAMAKLRYVGNRFLAIGTYKPQVDCGRSL